MQPNRSAHVLPTAMLLAAMAAPASAQCTTQWLPGLGRPGTAGAVAATTMWDPDGAGPAQPVLLVAGAFSSVGDLRAHGVARYEPSLGTWSSLGSEPGVVFGALAALPNGGLYAAGSEVVSGITLTFVAQWTGASWARLGSGMNGPITALAAMPNGDIVASGGFTIAGNVFADRVARWNGSAWAPLGAGMTMSGGASPTVDCLTVLPNGDLVAGGRFTTAGGVSATNIARWDGTAWFPLGTGLQPTPGPFSFAWVHAVACLPNGEVLAGGLFGTAGGVVARWDGTQWSPLGTGWYTTVKAIRVLPNGHVLAGGDNGAFGYNVARWNGVNWANLGAGTSGSPYTVYSISELPNGDVVAAGGFTGAGGVPAANLARWNGAAWSPMAVDHSLPDNELVAAAFLPNGDLVAAGAFRFLGAAVANGIARRVGDTWVPMGTGMQPYSGVTSVAVLPNGDVIAGGVFHVAGGVAVNNIARWNGVAWSPLGGGINGGVARLFARRNGDLFATSYTGIWQWDGLAWTQISPGTGVAVLTELANGDLVAAGHLLAGAGVTVARWTGTTWVPSVPGYWSAVNALVELPNGDLMVSGSWTFSGVTIHSLVGRWNGANWWVEGQPARPNSAIAPANALTVLPDGSVLAAGNFSSINGVAAASVARWDGLQWSALGTGLTGHFNGLTGTASYASAMVRAPNDDVVVVGNFASAGTQVSLLTARLTSTCPATAVSYGAGCAGAGGANVLTAKSLPWVGSSYTAEATGLAPLALAVGVRSLSTTSIPLSAILPQGLPGCTLLATPDGVDIYVPTAGRVEMSFPIPNLALLAGQVVYQQVVSLELNAALSITALTSTNGLTTTIGAF